MESFIAIVIFLVWVAGFTTGYIFRLITEKEINQ
jgi:hypothetical protein